MLLDREQGSASRARRWVVDRALEAGLSDEDRDVVELLAAELIANAMEHGPAGGAVTVETTSDADQFGVYVFDDAAQPPVMRGLSPDALGGRGMVLVDTLATDWGCTPLGPASKVVWFSLAVRRLAVAS